MRPGAMPALLSASAAGGYIGVVGSTGQIVLLDSPLCQHAAAASHVKRLPIVRGRAQRQLLACEADCASTPSSTSGSA